MSNIFINYRRGDDPGFTQALYGRLEAAFSPERLFMDVDNIAPGIDFVQALNDQVAQCDVLIAVIGQGWLAAADETGERRLDNPDDFVRIEIESALTQKKRVIPVLVNDAKMPRAADLPSSLVLLARCNAVRLTHERFRADMQGLIKSLEQVLKEAEDARERDDERRKAEEELARREEKERSAKQQMKRHEAADQEHGPKSARDQKIREEADNKIKAEAKRRKKTAKGDAMAASEAAGFVGWVTSLPSDISWRVALGLIVIYVLGWLVPGFIFTTGGFGWGAWSFLYGVVGLIAVGVSLYLWRRRFAGPDLALAWFGVLSFVAVIGVSVQTWLALSLNTDSWMLLIAVSVAAGFIRLRRDRITGLEVSVYWAGLMLLFFWGTIFSVARITAVAELDASLFGSGNGYRAAATILAAVFVVATLGILAWRRSRLTRQELTVYGLALAYLLITSTLLLLDCTYAAC